jgi:hypothetical protein
MNRPQIRKQRILERIKQHQLSEEQQRQAALDKIREIRSRLKQPAL